MSKGGVYHPMGDCICESCGIPFFAWIEDEIDFQVGNFENFAEHSLCRKCHLEKMRYFLALNRYIDAGGDIRNIKGVYDPKKEGETIESLIEEYMKNRSDGTQSEKLFAFVCFLVLLCLALV